MKFVCDAMLGKLAKYLRLLGFDASYAPSKAALEREMLREPGRMVLTRRTKNDFSSPTVRVRSEMVRAQLDEIKDLIKVDVDKTAVLDRCIECNLLLVDVDKTDVESLVPEFVYHAYARFKVCPSCKRVYWEGTHAKGMEKLIEEILN